MKEIIAFRQSRFEAGQESIPSRLKPVSEAVRVICVRADRRKRGRRVLAFGAWWHTGLLTCALSSLATVQGFSETKHGLPFSVLAGGLTTTNSIGRALPGCPRDTVENIDWPGLDEGIPQ